MTEDDLAAHVSQWVDPIREAWDASSEPTQPYTAGTWGPSASSEPSPCRWAA